MRSKDTNRPCDSCRLQTATPSAAQKWKNIERVQRYFCVSFGKTLSEPSSPSVIYGHLMMPGLCQRQVCLLLRQSPGRPGEAVALNVGTGGR